MTTAELMRVVCVQSFGRSSASRPHIMPDCGTLLIVPLAIEVAPFAAGSTRTVGVVAINVATPGPKCSKELGMSPGRRLFRRPPFRTWFPLSVFALTRFINFVMISLSARTQIALTH